MFAEFKQGPEDFKQRIHSTLPDTLVVVAEQLGELKGARLDVGKEALAGGVEERANSISSDLLLDSDSTVDVHHFVEVNILQFNALIAIVVSDGDGVGRR